MALSGLQESHTSSFDPEVEPREKARRAVARGASAPMRTQSAPPRHGPRVCRWPDQTQVQSKGRYREGGGVEALWLLSCGGVWLGVGFKYVEPVLMEQFGRVGRGVANSG